MSKKIDQEGMHTVTDESGSLIAILRQDPVSKKNIVYLTHEAGCSEIADLIKTEKELGK